MVQQTNFRIPFAPYTPFRIVSLSPGHLHRTSTPPIHLKRVFVHAALFVTCLTIRTHLRTALYHNGCVVDPLSVSIIQQQRGLSTLIEPVGIEADFGKLTCQALILRGTVLISCPSLC